MLLAKEKHSAFYLLMMAHVVCVCIAMVVSVGDICFRAMGLAAIGLAPGGCLEGWSAM